MTVNNDGTQIVVIRNLVTNMVPDTDIFESYDGWVTCQISTVTQLSNTSVFDRRKRRCILTQKSLIYSQWYIKFPGPIHTWKR